MVSQLEAKIRETKHFGKHTEKAVDMKSLIGWNLKAVAEMHLGSTFVYLNFSCLFLRERERASRGREEREGDTESKAGSRL